MKRALKTFAAVTTATALSVSIMSVARVSAINKLEWRTESGYTYWYEDGVRQGTTKDPKSVLGDGINRGREIYDPVSDGWYWLDSVYEGAKATNKEVWVPYVYQNEKTEGFDTVAVAAESGELSGCVESAINDGAGKWVRYDANGKMIKGWYTVDGNDEKLYPSQVGNTYYYDERTGLMAKGTIEMDGQYYNFNETTGVLESIEPIIPADPDLYKGSAPYQWKLEVKDYDLSDFSDAQMSCGNGAAVDELNRPLSALDHQNNYGSLHSYYIRDDVTENRVFLTFDEGYENGYTPAILDTLQEKGVKAVFFVTMSYVKHNPELVQRIIDEGHILGNHSVSHPSVGISGLGSYGEMIDEVMDLHNYVAEEFGYEMWLFRYPAGIYSEETLALMQNLGYASVLWSTAYRDWNPEDQPDYDYALNFLKAHACPGNIYLLHAVSETNTNVLGQFIDEMRDDGYSFSLFNVNVSN